MNHALILLLAGCFAVRNTVGQPCPQYAMLMKDGKTFKTRKNYYAALNKYNAAKLCNPAKAPEVDERICELYEAIEAGRQEAVMARIVAEISRRQAVAARKQAEAATKRAIAANAEAQRQANEARALYWASESDKLEPVQATHVLAAALNLSSDALPVRERFVRRVNELPAMSEKFRPRFRTDFLYSVGFSPDSKKNTDLRLRRVSKTLGCFAVRRANGRFQTHRLYHFGHLLTRWRKSVRQLGEGYGETLGGSSTRQTAHNLPPYLPGCSRCIFA